jgi:hypothetical protein
MTDRPQRSHIDVAERFAQHDCRVAEPAMARLLSVGGDLPRDRAATKNSDSDAERSDCHRPDSDRGGRSTSGSGTYSPNRPTVRDVRFQHYIDRGIGGIPGRMSIIDKQRINHQLGIASPPGS